MSKLVVGIAVVVCLCAVAMVAILALWEPEGESAWQVETGPAVAGAGPDGAPPETGSVEPIKWIELPDSGTPTARSPSDGPNWQRVTATRRRQPAREPVPDDEILRKLEEAIGQGDVREARELTRDLVRAVKEGRLDADEVADRLIALLKGNMDLKVMRGVLPQLGFLENEKLSQFFREQYWATEDLTMRALLLNALRQSVGADSIAFLQEILQTEEKQSLRNQALFGLSRVGDETSLAMLEQIARSGSGVDQQTSLQLLCNRRDPAYVPLFEQILAGAGGPGMYETAIRGLQQVGTESSIPVLQGVIDNPDASEHVKNLAQSAIQSIEGGPPEPGAAAPSAAGGGVR